MSKFGRPKRPAVDRFWEKVVKLPGEDACWLREGSSSRGYSTFRDDNGEMIYAHIFSYELHCGPVPPGLQVCHWCDVRNCVNPDHFWVGNQSQNIIDAVSKGRWTHVVGQRNGMSRTNRERRQHAS